MREPKVARRENHNSDCGSQQLKLYQRYGQNNKTKKFSQNIFQHAQR